MAKRKTAGKKVARRKTTRTKAAGRAARSGSTSSRAALGAHAVPGATGTYAFDKSRERLEKISSRVPHVAGRQAGEEASEGDLAEEKEYGGEEADYGAEEETGGTNDESADPEEAE